MIGDLTGAPEPVVVKLFSQDPELLAARGRRRWPRRSTKVTIGGATPIVDVEDGIENTTSGPAVVFKVEPQKRPRAPGSRAEELGTVGVAMMEGEPARGAGDRQRSSVHAPRPLSESTRVVARGDEQHAAGQLDGRHRHARARWRGRRDAGADRSPAREPAAARRGHGAPRRRRPGDRRRGGAEGGRRPEAAAVDPRGVRRHLSRSSRSRSRISQSCWCWRSS